MRTISILLALLLPSAALAQPETWTDGARTTLAEDLDTTETGIDLTSGAAFPSTPASPGYFTITVRSVATPSTFEIMRCTARSTNTLTCARDCVSGTCDNTGTSFSTGDNVYLSITAASLIRGLNGAGSNREVTFNESSVPGGADNVLIDNNSLVLREVSTATLSGVGPRLIGRRISPSFPVRLSWFTPSGAVPSFASPDLWNTQVACLSGGTSSSNLGGWYAATAGTISYPTPANTSRFTRRLRALLTSAASANFSARITGHLTVFGGSGYAGGTVYFHSWAIDTDNGTTRFQAILGSSVSSSTEPTSHTNYVGLVADSGSANLAWTSNNGSGTATTHTSCGASFPKTGGLYSAAITIAPDGASYYGVLRREDSSVADCVATMSSDLPADGTALGYNLIANTGGTASAVALSVNNICTYIPREVQGYAP